MSILFWIFIGTFFGIIFSKKNKGNAMVHTVSVGLIGAFSGGVLATILSGIPIAEFNLHTIVVAVFGAWALLWIGKSVV